ncbi:hypothetical protein TREPR_0763 [Treponema primitia ZAS-2]|uniref:Uncharacterized protein n=1 Tax=Treponema primitia (strain ATCC BAA-887 / DSM 12427 / ZAS-2) TaxID=545694 RepID=F5YJC8_TREPZ|nr:hypothetical protein TREPR_0763 [Treponema primitia ZAS-2]
MVKNLDSIKFYLLTFFVVYFILLARVGNSQTLLFSFLNTPGKSAIFDTVLQFNTKYPDSLLLQP